MKPTAIDKLCELLEEQEIAYKRFGNRVWWGQPIDSRTGKPIEVYHNEAEPMGEDRLYVKAQLTTPERAVHL